MEKNRDEALLKVRSSRVCIADGYRLYTGNFKKIFRRTWVLALLYGLICGAYTSILVGEFPKMLTTVITGQMMNLKDVGPLLLTIPVLLLLTIIYTWYYSQFFTMLSQHRTQGVISAPTRFFSISTDSRILLHAVVCMVFCLLMDIGIYIIIGGLMVLASLKQSLVAICLCVLLILLTIVLAVPLGYPFMRYLTTRETHFWKTLKNGYGWGFRHWGMIFTVTFVTIIVCAVFLMVTTLPANLLFMANIKAHMGQMMGDPLGMPDYISKLTFVVFSLACFIQAYIIPSLLFPAYYVAGSIEAQEKERKIINEKS